MKDTEKICKQLEKMQWKLKQLPMEIESAQFYGFTLKRGFWFGFNHAGQAIAASGWNDGLMVAVYTRKQGKWKLEWYDVREYFIPDEFAYSLDGMEIRQLMH